MATKIYQSGNFLTIEQPNGNTKNLPLGGYYYAFVGSDTVHFGHTQEASNLLTITAQISTLQDQSGALIGGLTELQAYLSDMGSPVDVASDLGGAIFSDETHTLANPFQLTAADGFVALPCNDPTPFITDGSPAIAATFVDTNGVLRPDNGNSDYYITRLSFNADPSTNNKTIFIKIDIGTAEINPTTVRLSANRNTVTPVSVNLPYFAGANFFANGGIILISTDDTGTMNVYDIQILPIKIIKR